ncbi:hypothetical protein [Janthinobacterium sp. 1_2014MBL_MicDiv]|uniref:hypothetical protein n=1 Tax=Janthinobacterium sp. 1_2014MBL_MicDiv TaxID=1644131 RepID=UPI0012EC1D88|nr:hypothetical protein [Janthinobacterium sp. 1_2014MBL_MicDiv]
MLAFTDAAAGPGLRMPGGRPCERGRERKEGRRASEVLLGVLYAGGHLVVLIATALAIAWPPGLVLPLALASQFLPAHCPPEAVSSPCRP